MRKTSASHGGVVRDGKLTRRATKLCRLGHKGVGGSGLIHDLSARPAYEMHYGCNARKHFFCDMAKVGMWTPVSTSIASCPTSAPIGDQVFLELSL
jgi:hypothetical protein